MLFLLATALCSPVETALTERVHDPTALLGRLAERGEQLEVDLATLGETDGLAERLAAEVAANLDAKPPGLPLSEAEIARTVIDFEAFRMRTTITSGVTPKRYFGYFDGRWDTARWEGRLRETTRATAAVLAEVCAERGHDWTISEAEVAVTWVAEGGALWLGEESHRLAGGFHPVMDVGLDDIARGLRDETELIGRLDRANGTELTSLVRWIADPQTATVPTDLSVGEIWLAGERDDGRTPVLARTMTFDESVVATGLMVLWEKEIADDQAARHGVRLGALDADRQWVAMSLVYNSGMVHLPRRWDAITALDSASWLHGAMRTGSARRWALDLLPAADRLESLRRGDPYPDQPTAWLAGYHILQRYGAYVALREYADVFDAEGSFIPLHVPSRPIEAAAPEP